MPIWALDVIGTSALSIVASYGFLLLRFRGVGRPFGPRAKWWTVAIILITEVISTGFGLAAAAASHDIRAVYAGLVVPGGLWLSKMPPQRDRDMRPRTRSALLTLPFSYLYDRMGDDMQAWCDARLSWASQSPLGLTDAVEYYYRQVAEQLADERVRAPLDRWRESVTYKTSIVRLIRLDATPATVRAALLSRPLTRGLEKYVAWDPALLARRLESDAETELGLFLAYLYRLGYNKLAAFPAEATLPQRFDSSADGPPRRRVSATMEERLLGGATVGVSAGVGVALGVAGGGGLTSLTLIPAAILGVSLLRGLRRDADQPSPAPAVPSGASVDAQLISFWISELQVEEERPITVGTAYTGVFQVGAPAAGNVAEGERTIPLSDIPSAGLETEWVVWSMTVRLEDAAGQDPALVEATTAEAGDQVQWMARFRLVIPRQGDSEERRLRLVPLTAGTARIDAMVLVSGDVYRRVSIGLTAREQPSPAEPAPVPAQADTAVVDVAQVRELPLRHTRLVPCGKWQTPGQRLSVVLLRPQAFIQSSAGRTDIVEWHPEQTVNQIIDSVRRGLDAFRAQHSGYLDAIEPDDLAARLRRITPASDWQASAEPADQRHLRTWEHVGRSEELRTLAYQGNRLYDAMFPVGKELRKLIDDLKPGDRLDMTWFSKSGFWISHVPWALMYRQEVSGPESFTDPGEFLGMRLRIACKSRPMQEYTRALGALQQTTRGHILYWGGTATDPTAIEAVRHKRELAVWAPLVLPSGETLRKREVRRFLAAPTPSPVSVLYLYCRCSAGTGADPVLQFGSTNAEDDLLELIDIDRGPLDDQPLAFLNGCDTASAAPFFSNMLEDVFLKRGCRAFIGTEAKVPIGFAARFATTFFSFLYRENECPVSAGEAFAQARKFLWDQYRNLGGLLYSYVNDYDLFAASDERVAELRRVS